MYAEFIKKIILQKKVVALKESIGEDLYFYATKRAGLFKAILPSVNVPGGVGVDLTKEELFKMGKYCFELSLDEEAPGLVERLKLKFPASVEWNFSHSVEQEQKTRAWNLISKLLVKEVEPSVAVCFT